VKLKDLLMNKLFGFIHRAVRKANLEEFFVSLRRRVNFLRRCIPVGMRHRFASVGRFIPQSSSYPPDDNYFLTRDDTHYEINRSDYVQWRIFYGIRDNALLMAKKYLAADSVILDIGANFGGFSLRLATYARAHNYLDVQIHAFEPNPIIYRRYRENLALNPSLNTIVHIHPAGLGSQSGERSFKYDHVNTGAGRIINNSNTETTKVTIQRLDDFIAELKPAKISFIKMIVEGFEPEVFKGGWNTIRKFRPPIFFEVTPEWYAENNSSLDEILSQLIPLGYTFMGEYYNELISYEKSKFASLYQFNLLALPG
jgi:FkbM family methyltransferase